MKRGQPSHYYEYSCNCRLREIAQTDLAKPSRLAVHIPLCKIPSNILEMLEIEFSR